MAGMLVPQLESLIVPSATVTVTGNGSDFTDLTNTGGFFFLNITAASGTLPTLDVKIQVKSVAQGIYIDLPGAAFTQKTATGTDMLVVRSDITAVANKAVSSPLPATFRLVWTVGGTTPSFTFSVNYCPAE